MERPLTKLELMNDISEVKAVTSDGNVLLDAVFDIIYERKADGTIAHSTVLNKEKSKGYCNGTAAPRTECSTTSRTYPLS